MQRPRAIVLGLIGALLLLALVLGLIFAFSYFVTGLYLLGVVFASVMGYVTWRKRLATPSLARQQIFVLSEMSDRRFGRLVGRFGRFLTEAIAVLTWPIQFLRGFYIAVALRPEKVTQQVMLFGQILVPAWFGPVGFTFIALLLVLPHADDQPLKLLAGCFLLSTFLLLTNSSLIGNVKEDVLSRPGNPKIAYALILLLNLGCAALSRTVISGWSGAGQPGILQSAYAIVSFADLRAIAEAHHLTFGEIVDDVGVLWNVSRLPLPLTLQALLGVLFYLAFVRIGLDFFGIKREARHYLSQGTAYAAVGRFDKALPALTEAKQDKMARLVTATIHLRQGDYQAMRNSMSKVCALCSIPFSPEEEATIALLFATDVVRIDGATTAAFFEARAAEFRDPHTATLLALLAFPLMEDELKAIDTLPQAAVLRDDPFFQALQAGWDGDRQLAEERLEQGDDSTSFAALILAVLIRAMLLLTYEPSEIPPESRQALDDAVERFAAARERFDEHWQLLTGYLALQRARTLYFAVMDEAHPLMTEIFTGLRATLSDTELLGEHFGVLTAVHDREFKSSRDIFAS